MAISPSFFTCSNLGNSHLPSKPISTSVPFSRARISAVLATSTATNSSSLYEVLGVAVGADTLVVKSAYRRLARVLHPDVGSSESSADEFMRVHSAYTTLADPEKRADYDRSLVRRRNIARSSGPSRRWETDQCW
ncbi:hypothetical protein SSX86_019929 [Deinandra increscens subsp. villosa]|uniref:J domain-containing protein n=1 Tax=Deinandra increscens subsp. villosa TaxID=3103831 RepID=A0AAP0CTJ5_9ASTR